MAICLSIPTGIRGKETTEDRHWYRLGLMTIWQMAKVIACEKINCEIALTHNDNDNKKIPYSK